MDPKILRSILDGVLDPIIIQTEDKFAWLNPAACKLFAINSPDELVGKSIFDPIHPDYREAGCKRVKDATEHELPSNEMLEYKLVRLDGSEVWVESKSEPVTYKGKKGSLVFLRDITMRKAAEQALQDNEERMRFALETSSIGVWEMDLDSFTTKRSLVHDMIFGYPSLLPEWTFNFFLRHVHPDDHGFVLEKFESLNGFKGDWNLEFRIIRVDGQTRWVWVAGRYVKDTKRKSHRIIGVIQDITKARQAEKELKESEVKFRNLFDEHAAVKLIIDRDNGNIIDANKAATKFYGWTKDELMQMNISQINTLSKAEIQKELVRARTHPNLHYSFQHRKANGDVRDVEIFSSGISINGKLLQHSIIHDVTEKVQTQKQLMLLSRSVEQSPVSIMITGINGDIEYVNPHFESTTGYTLDEVRNQNPRILKSGYQPAEVYEKMWNTILSGKEWTGELINKKKNRDIHWERIAISPILNAQGKVTNFVSVREDITEHKKLVENLVMAKEKAEESDRLTLAFLANISHEIRTPMNGILGFAQLLKEPGLKKKERQRFIDIIEKSGHRMLDTVNDLIDIARIESGQAKLQMSAIHLGQQLNNLYDFFLPQAKEKGLELLFKPLSGFSNLYIKTDPNKLDSILSNLIKNAIKFTDQGKVEFGCFSRDNQLEFYVSDTGIGIQKNRQHIVFNRFEQADIDDVRSFQGSGLGLAIAKAYVELLGGKIWLKSMPGKGSTFYFTTQYIKADHANVESTGNIGFTNEGIPQLTDKTILIAEDDLYSREMVIYLIRKTGANLVVACDGAEALQCYQNKKFDLILLDIRLPEMNGYVVLEEIRKTSPDLPVIAQSAYALADDIRMFREFGFTDYITKPINPDLLYEILARYLTVNKRYNDHTALTGTNFKSGNC